MLTWIFMQTSRVLLANKSRWICNNWQPLSLLPPPSFLPLKRVHHSPIINSLNVEIVRPLRCEIFDSVGIPSNVKCVWNRGKKKGKKGKRGKGGRKNGGGTRKSTIEVLCTVSNTSDDNEIVNSKLFFFFPSPSSSSTTFLSAINRWKFNPVNEKILRFWRARCLPVYINARTG